MKKINLLFEQFPTLETNQFILREVQNEDVDAIYKIYSNKEAVRYQATNAMEAMEQAYKSIQAFQNGFKDKRFIRWCIVRKEDNLVVGLLALHSFEELNSKAAIGFMLNKEFWRQNIMSEAAEKVINYAFNEINLNRIEATIHPENIASIKLSEKLGFQKEGLKKQAILNPSTNKFEDRILMALLNIR